MRRGSVVMACLAAMVAVASAEPPVTLGGPDAEPFTPPPEIPKGRSYSELIAQQLTVLGDSVDGHLGALTLDAVKFRIDGRQRRAQLRLAGESRFLSLKVEGDVHFRRGAAEVDATIDLMVGGHVMRFELPDFQVLPRSYLGERYVEVRVPLIRGSF